MLRKSYYEKLNDVEKAVYRQIANGIKGRQTKIAISALVDERVFEALNLEHPEFYFVDLNNVKIRQVGEEVFCFVKYLYAEDKIAETESRLAWISESFSKCSGEELLRKMHNYLVKNVKYDWDEVDGKKAVDMKNHSLVGPLMNGIGVCEGISKAFAYLISRFGVDNKIVKGESKGQPHCWNMVMLNGNSYHIDVTNDMENSDSCYGKPCYFYYLISDEDMVSIADFSDDIKCFARVDNPFYKNGRVFSDVDMLFNYLKTLPKSNRTVYFKYTGEMSENELVERVSRMRVGAGTEVKYCLDATRTVYLMRFGE